MFPLSTSLWALCIGITVYRLIVYKTQSENIYLYFHLLCWGFPLGLSVFGSIKHMYGEAGSWCWVSSEKNQILMQYVEMIGIFILILGIYVRVLWWTISSQSVGSSRMRQRYKEDVQRILWFPLVFLIAWSGGLINRLYSTLHDESYALNILMYITIPSCGWLNAIAYVVFERAYHTRTPRIYYRTSTLEHRYAVTNNDIQIMYSKMFPCCRRHRRGKDPSSPDSMSNGQSTHHHHHHPRTMSPYSASDQESLLPAHMLRALKHDPTLSPDCMKVRTTVVLSHTHRRKYIQNQHI